MEASFLKVARKAGRLDDRMANAVACRRLVLNEAGKLDFDMHYLVKMAGASDEAISVQLRTSAGVGTEIAGAHAKRGKGGKMTVLQMLTAWDSCTDPLRKDGYFELYCTYRDFMEGKESFRFPDRFEDLLLFAESEGVDALNECRIVTVAADQGKAIREEAALHASELATLTPSGSTFIATEADPEPALDDEEAHNAWVMRQGLDGGKPVVGYGPELTNWIRWHDEDVRSMLEEVIEEAPNGQSHAYARELLEDLDAPEALLDTELFDLENEPYAK